MPQPDWEGLESEVRNLADRVARIEHELGLSRREAPVAPPAQSGGISEPSAAAPLTPILGRAVLGLAGAYLLRAFTESGSVTAAIGVAIGLVYAILWLVWAARTPAANRLEAATHSLTSVLVLCPLLWEATLRFHAIRTGTAGVVLLFFTLFGLAVSWRKDLLIVATIATLVGLGTASALLVATRDVLPFLLVLLAIAAAVEISACLEHWVSERWLAATAADLAVLLATWLVTNERGLPDTYAPIPHYWLLAAQMTLLAIYLSSTIVRTLVRGFTFTVFETAQCGLAFLVAIGGGLRLSSADPRLGPAMASLTLACAGACYVVAFRLLDRAGARGRNFYTYSTFGILLAVVGTRILLAGTGADVAWSILAVGCTWAGAQFGRLTLQVHGGVYLLLAIITSGALSQSAAFLLGSDTWPGTRDAVLIGGAAAAAVCYWLAVRHSREQRGWSFRAFRVAAAGALAWLAAGIVAGLMTAGYHGIFGPSATHAYCATMRTGILSLSALWLAWAGSRWESLELSHLIYPAMAVGAYRLVMDDLHQDRKAALFLSLLFYGAVLMVLPRLSRRVR